MKTNLNTFLCIVCAIILLSSCAKERSTEPVSEEGFVDAGKGVKLFYQKVGDGRNKVIIPMGLYLYEDFRNLAYSKDRTLVFYDVRNRGRSSHITDSTLISIWEDVKDLERVRNHFGYEKVDVVGWSYLGMMVMLYTSQHPEHVDRVVQVGPVALQWNTAFPAEYRNTDPSPLDTAVVNEVERQRRDGLNQRDPKKFTEMWYSAYVFPELFGDSANVRKFRGQLLRTLEPENELHDNFMWHINQHFGGSIQNMNTDSLWVEMRKIQQPVLTVHGTKDRNAVYGAGRQWVSELPNARLVTAQNAAHLPWLEKPNEVFPAIDKFLDGEWPAEAVELENAPQNQ